MKVNIGHAWKLFHGFVLEVNASTEEQKTVEFVSGFYYRFQYFNYKVAEMSL